MNKRIIISVTSDLSTDQRVHRAALTLHESGYDVLLVGRFLKNSFDISMRPYKTKRFKLWFNKGPLFYANYNLRLFFFLMFKRMDILLANDLDSLLPNYLASKFKSKILVYDNHEYYTGVPELVSRPFVRGIWKSIERWIFQKLKYVYTVNQSIADLYQEEYKVKVSVVRNVPSRIITEEQFSKKDLRVKLNLPLDKFLIIMQGNGINVERGGEEAIQAMQFVEDGVLLIVGNGDVIDVLKKMTVDLKLQEKIIFRSRMPYHELMQHTQCADLGLTLDKSTNINYRFSLPNKLFDYIQCGVPVLASDLVEVKKIIQQYNIGAIAENIFPLELAKKISEIMKDDDRQKLWKENIKQAAKDLNWENEKAKLLEIFEKISPGKKGIELKEQHLHIISFDIPYPPNYGGVIDVFYKIKSLHKLGVKVQLHCFEYGRKKTEELNEYCETVNYYKRNTAKSQLFNRLPYIIISRASEELMQNLLHDNAPILFEGLHCCYFLNDVRIKDRIKIVRTHNIEHDYYQSLARVEKDIFKRYYFYNEAGKLENFEPALQYVNYIAAISLNDTAYFQDSFKNAHYIPAFHSNENINCKTGRGEYALYHGNLGIGENNEAALYLVKEVFNDDENKFIIAGNKPSKELRDAVAKKSNIELHADISIEAINLLITGAHINILPTFQPTGIKLKLLTALFNGRHCLVNDVMVANTNLENLCHIVHNAEEFKTHLKKLLKRDFTIEELEKRKKILNENFSNDVSAKKLLELLK